MPVLTQTRRLSCPCLVLALSLGCADDSGSDAESDATAGTTGETAEAPPEEGPVIEGITIEAVAIYQGVKRGLSQAGAPLSSEIPLIAGRDALVRVYHSAPPEQVGEAITAVLEIAGHAPLSVDTTLSLAAQESQLETTINFEVDGAWIGPSLDYSVEVFAAGSPSVSARYPAEGSETHIVEGGEQIFELTLVPYIYNADGSGRVPDTSEAALAAYRERFLQLYPVSEVELTLHSPVEWGGPLTAFGQGWQELMMNISQLRQADGVDPEVYYYGIADPADSFDQFCDFGCLLGVTLLNDAPASMGDPSLRWALGVGFLDYAANTAVHEIGHSHGRQHVNCGQGLAPNSVDANYPHATDSIGVWGWDIVNGGLRDPTQHTDYMGYCESQWTSDYTYRAMFERGNLINQAAQPSGPERRLTVVGLDGKGGGEWLGALTRRDPGSSRPQLKVALTDSDGHVRQVEGQFLPYDHLPGGWLLVPEAAAAASRIELSLADGTHTILER